MPTEHLAIITEKAHFEHCLLLVSTVCKPHKVLIEWLLKKLK